MRTYNDISRPEYTPEQISELKADEIFVFGSNLEGMHGGGAAAWTRVSRGLHDWNNTISLYLNL